MGWLNRHLAIRQTAYALAVVVVLTTALGSVETFVTYNGERQRLVSTMNQLFESVADTSARAAYHVDKRQAEAALDGLMKFESLATAIISTDLGVVLAARNRDTDSGIMDSLANWLFGDILSQQRTLMFDPFTLITSVNKSEADNVLSTLVGEIELRASPGYVARNFLGRVGGLIAALVLELLLVAAALAYIFHRTLTKSLLQYADDLSNIDVQGSTMTQASIPHGHEHDEFGLVVSRTNKLLQQIFESHEAEAHAKHELEDSERRFRSTFDNAAVGIVDLDKNHRIVRVNSRIAEMLGYDIGSLVGLDQDSLVHREDIDTDRESLTRLIGGKISTYAVDKRFIRNDGSIMFGSITVSMVRDLDNPDHSNLVVVVQDVTHSKQQEAKIEAQRDALIHREKIAALGSMLAGVAHELNNPLAVVMAQAELLAETATDQKSRDRADKILKPAERCSRIVRTFLALARQREIKKTSLKIECLIEEVRELLEYQFKTNNIELTIDIPSDIPDVLGDEDQLSQVLMNLLINSQQALTEKTGQRKVGLRVAKVSEQSIAIKISDNGPGIPKSIQEHIFEPFFTTKPEGQGTGLGLSYCQSVVERHGGNIFVDKAQNSGATISVEIPIGLVEVKTDEQLEPKIVGSGSKFRVLVVDDEARLLETMVEQLQLMGYSAVGYPGATEAMDAILNRDFDIVITDIRMPGVDGPTFYGEVCAQKPELKDRFIFVTGDSLNEHASHFIKNNNAPCVYKPFKMEDLDTAIREIINRGGHLIPERVIAASNSSSINTEGTRPL